MTQQNLYFSSKLVAVYYKRN